MVDASWSYAIHHFIKRIIKIISNLMTHDEPEVRSINMWTLQSLSNILNSETFYEDFFKE